MDKFDDKYRIESHRLYGWDYSEDGVYFITLVIHNRELILGEIKNQKILFSEFGKIVREEWLNSFKIREELILDEFVIMPNHLHGLIILKKQRTISDADAETHGRASLPGNQKRTFSRQYEPTKSEFKRKPKSVSSFVAGFKTVTTKRIDDLIDAEGLGVPKYNAQNKLWQANFHDHIVRNEKEYWKIKYYIKNNPKNWEDDEYNV